MRSLAFMIASVFAMPQANPIASASAAARLNGKVKSARTVPIVAALAAPDHLKR